MKAVLISSSIMALSYFIHLFLTDCNLCFLHAGCSQFEEPQQPAGYSQVSATAMAPPGPPSWASESHKPAPPASGQTAAKMVAPFTVQQNPPTGSATPSLSSCSTVRTGRRERMLD